MNYTQLPIFLATEQDSKNIIISPMALIKKSFIHTKIFQCSCQLFGKDDDEWSIWTIMEMGQIKLALLQLLVTSESKSCF